MSMIIITIFDVGFQFLEVLLDCPSITIWFPSEL